MKTKIYSSYDDFCARQDKYGNGVSQEFANLHPDWENMNETNIGCWNCSDCSGCFDCYRCSGLESAEKLPDTKGDYPGLQVPVVNDIHSKIMDAVSNPGSLKMNDWHTCDTTHCRAGWAVHLAGPEGYALEKKTSTQFAAMMIFKKSSTIKVSPVRFFEDNKTAMEDIKRCAELENSMRG